MITLDLELLGGPIARDTKSPAHQLVRERLLDLVRRHSAEIGTKLPSEPEIAEALGVSRMTANKAILGLVAEGWLQREKGKGTFVARRAPGQRNSKYSVLVNVDPSVAGANHYYGPLFYGIQAEVIKHGVPFTIRPYSDDLLENLVEDGVEGLIVLNPQLSDIPLLHEIAATVTAVVVLGSRWDAATFDCVDSDNVLGALVAVKHLTDLGHRRIQFIGALSEDRNTQDRLRGFEIAAKLHKLDLDGIAPIVSEDALELEPWLSEELPRRLRRPNAPTAIFAAGSALAMHTLSLTQRYGISVPDELSLIAYDDPAFLNLANPPLTTLRQPLAEMARQACLALFRRSAHPEVPPALTLLDPELVVRASTGPLSNP